MQALIVILEGESAFLLARIIFSTRVDNVAAHNFLPEGEASADACDQLLVSQCSMSQTRVNAYLTAVHAISRRHCEEPMCVAKRRLTDFDDISSRWRLELHWPIHTGVLPKLMRLSAKYIITRQCIAFRLGTFR